MALRKQDINLEQLLHDVKKGFHKIYSNDMSKADYIPLYTLVYNFCITATSESTPPKNQLYKDLNSFLCEHLQTVYNKFEDLIDEPLLLLYAKHWENYCLSSKVLNEVCRYLNKHWIRRERFKGRIQVLQVYLLALVSWKDSLLERLQKRISRSVIKLIQQDRRGEAVDTRLINNVLKSFIEVEIDRAAPYSKNSNLRFYKEAFEAEFLLETEVFYVTEIDSIIVKEPISEVLKKIENWFIEESRRAQSYLHETTLEELKRILDAVVINKYSKNFFEEFKLLLNQNQTEDLKRMHHLLSRSSGGLNELKIQFEQFAASECLLEIEIYHLSGVKDPEAYVNAILGVVQRINLIILTAFENEADFVRASDKAFEKVINENAVTKSKSSSKSAELLAKYCDILLKKKITDLREIEIADDLNQAMVIFKYINEKDVFLSFYSKLLAKRLVQQANATSNDYIETMMISKLREVCGFGYTTKLQAMLQDARVSRELTERFKNENLLSIDVSMKVIRSSSWPIKEFVTISLPKELEQSVQQFTSFYCSRFSGRKLTWLHGTSRGDIASKCFEKPYIFRATASQIAVLLQFNTQCTMSFKQLMESTSLKPEILIQILQTLTKHKLLKDVDNNPVTASSSITLNTAYQNERLKVNIIASIKYEKKAEQDIVRKNLKEDRKYAIQAIIVRIAKDRRIVKHHNLISEVIKQLSPRFKPDIATIKKCIEILIEKEYLVRVETDSYRYIL